MLGAVASSVGRELHQCPGLVKLEAASETGPAVVFELIVSLMERLQVLRSKQVK
jgi:hypothetical protein